MHCQAVPWQHKAQQFLCRSSHSQAKPLLVIALPINSNAVHRTSKPSPVISMLILRAPLLSRSVAPRCFAMPPHRSAFQSCSMPLHLRYAPFQSNRCLSELIHRLASLSIAVAIHRTSAPLPNIAMPCSAIPLRSKSKLCRRFTQFPAKRIALSRCSSTARYRSSSRNRAIRGQLFRDRRTDRQR